MPDFTLTLLPALDIAAFARGDDGSFASVSPPPPWFARLLADPTFPFLGHILEEAGQFWTGGAEGFQEFGPCAEVDESGEEFHYKVTAVTAAGSHYLLFQRDRSTDRMREVLQKARELALRAGDDSRTAAALAVLQREAVMTAGEVGDLVERLRHGRPSAGELEILDAILARCDRLRACTGATRVDRGSVDPR